MIEGKAVAKFGTGNILITPMVKTDFSGGFIVLQNKGTHTVGERTQNFEPGDDDTVLSFGTVEWIVFIKKKRPVTQVRSLQIRGREVAYNCLRQRHETQRERTSGKSCRMEIR